MAPSEVLRLESANTALRDAFLRWQCRLRQIAIRTDAGQPGDGMVPTVMVGDTDAMGRVVTVLCKLPEHSKTMEFRHMVKRTQDAAERRSSALGFLGELYYQRFREFSDTLTATFAPGSAGAERIRQSGRCRLLFEQFNQRYELHCGVQRLEPGDALHDATFWHNLLFNPNLPANSVVLGFTPDWAHCVADPRPF